MYAFIQKILFLLPAETAHHFTTKSLKWLFLLPGIRALFKTQFSIQSTSLERNILGLHFKNPVGLAAGFDKNGAFTNEFEAMGFGFIEIGTVTPKPQPGNPKPRLFRLKKDQALINRMGFNNGGVERVAKNLKNKAKSVIIGGNIGKNKITPNEKAVDDYLTCFEALYSHVDYFVVNVSSPNTPGLRELQEKEPLKKLLQEVIKANKKQVLPKPIFLKIAPDLTNEQLDDILKIAKELKLDGLIATNTTIERKKLKSPAYQLEKIGAGGLSGAPLCNRSTEVIRYLRKRNKNIVIIGVGGIFSESDAIEKLEAGADLLQIYSGLVYQGPGLIRKINHAIINKS